MYAFAALLLAVFASLSAFSDAINLLGVLPSLICRQWASSYG
jgi:hypothetical protein